MTRKRLIAVGLAAGVAAVAILVVFWPQEGALADDADADGRHQTATWITGDSDPQFHLTPNHLHAVAGTQIPGDCFIEIELKDSDDVVLGTAWISGPNGADGGTVWIDNGLASYGSNSTFTITARYKDSNGNLNDTESISFVKP